MNIPTVEEQKAAREVIDDFVKHCENGRSELLEKLKTYAKNYAIEYDAGKARYVGRCKYTSPATHESCETILPRMIGIVTENGELKYEITPVGTEDETFTDYANALIKHDFKKANGRQKNIEITRSCLQNGTVVVGTPWNKEIKTRLEPEYDHRIVGEMPGEFGPVPVYREVLRRYRRVDSIIHEGVGLEVKDLSCMWIDPFQPDVEKAQAIVEEANISLEDLERERLRMGEPEPFRDPQTGMITAYIQRKEGHYFNLDGPDGLIERVRKATQSVTDKAAGKEQVYDQNAKTPRKRVRVKQYFGRFDKGDGQEVEYIIAKACDYADMIIRLELSEMPARPYIIARYIPISGRTFGIGIPELVANPHAIASDLMNQMVDQGTMNLRPMWQVRDNSDIDEKDLEYIPDGVVSVSEIDRDIAPLRQNMVGMNYGEKLVVFLRDEIRNATKATKNLQAIGQQYHTTATEIQSQESESMIGMLLGAINYEVEFIAPYLQRVIEYNYAFMPEGKLVRITNDEGATVEFKALSREDIAAQLDFTPMGATAFERKMKQRQALTEIIMSIGQFSQMIPEDKLRKYDFGLLFQTLFSTYTEIPKSTLRKIFPDSEEQQAGPPQEDALSAIQTMIGGNGAGMVPSGAGAFESYG